MRAKRMKLADIAREAGVSVTAVSFYINGKGREYKLSQATCDRIEEVVKKYDFVPNIFARAMQQNRTYLIGFLLPARLSTSFWSEIVAGIEEGISPHRYHLMLACAHSDAAGELEALKLMHSKGVDGYAIAPVPGPDGVAANLEYLKTLYNSGVPVVGVNLPLPGCSAVYNDDEAGGKAAAEYLLERQFCEAALIGSRGPEEHLRFQAFEETFRAAGARTFYFGSVDEWFAASHRPRAVFCCNDYLAAALCSRAGFAGIRIPDELTVVGYDDLDFLQLLRPRPASVHQFKYELGRDIAEILMDVLINGASNEPREKRFSPYVCIGVSSQDANALSSGSQQGVRK